MMKRRWESGDERADAIKVQMDQATSQRSRKDEGITAVLQLARASERAPGERAMASVIDGWRGRGAPANEQEAL